MYRSIQIIPGTTYLFTFNGLHPKRAIALSYRASIQPSAVSCQPSA
ncbi:hypothetical protein [Moorena sp. SIO2C4]|nr:hypothetical protein [Moorena sp. SIO2C4]NEQ07995.1 hypothetical protein [Moorena sp. SIO4E2]NEQ12621.1 hypothetical protein [Moorena sp. SIO3E2]NES39910.1 hypothetical protein [Moorena sp. SIO2C4]NET66179.1 hypothetical protein [Moorena sp. SIO1G6]